MGWNHNEKIVAFSVILFKNEFSGLGIHGSYFHHGVESDPFFFNHLSNGISHHRSGHRKRQRFRGVNR